jgi:hypothetical protein
MSKPVTEREKLCVTPHIGMVSCSQVLRPSRSMGRLAVMSQAALLYDEWPSHHGGFGDLNCLRLAEPLDHGYRELTDRGESPLQTKKHSSPPTM